MDNRNDYIDAFQTCLSQLHGNFAGICDKYPFATYERLMTESPPYSSYRCVSKKIVEFCELLKNEYSPEALAHYHRCLLLYLIANAPRNLDSSIYPSKVKEAFSTEFQRISSELTTNTVGFYCYDNDLYCKDLAVCTGKMFPIGALKTEVTGIPRNILFKGGWLQLLRLLRIFVKLGSSRPFYEIHLDTRYRSTFTPQGWDDCFLMIGKMLERNHEMLGFTGSSWFFDPQTRRVSPHLGYLRKLIEDNGGKFFYYKENEHTTELALESSSTRRKFYEQGAYKPASYLAIWPRAELLAWAEKQSHGIPDSAFLPAS